MTVDKIGDVQFHVMCEMWGVDQAIKAASRMGMKPSKEQVETERGKEAATVKARDSIFSPKGE